MIQHICSDEIKTRIPYLFEPRLDKPVFEVSDQVRHKPGSTGTEDC